MTQSINNTNLRNRMNDYIENNFQPSKKSIAKASGVDYTYFIKWLSKDRRMGIVSLSKINEFLNNNE